MFLSMQLHVSMNASKFRLLMTKILLGTMHDMHDLLRKMQTCLTYGYIEVQKVLLFLIKFVTHQPLSVFFRIF